MRIHHNPSGGNFGDQLNNLLMPRVFESILHSTDVTLIGIGTLFNEWTLDVTPVNRIWFSTGYGYNHLDTRPIEPAHLGTIYGVRGNLTAAALGLDSSLVCGDGAYLLRNYFDPPTVKLHRYSYMPHWLLAHPGWARVCEALGIHYIDPIEPPDSIIQDIGQTEIMICEAMHGAIVADALRVPWIPINSHESVLAFKWVDWLSTINVAFDPHRINCLYHQRDESLPRQMLFQYRVRRSTAELKRVIKTGIPQLSSDVKCNEIVDRLNQTAQQIVDDYTPE